MALNKTFIEGKKRKKEYCANLDANNTFDLAEGNFLYLFILSTRFCSTHIELWPSI